MISNLKIDRGRLKVKLLDQKAKTDKELATTRKQLEQRLEMLQEERKDEEP